MIDEYLFQDIIENTYIKLDATFKFSLISDAVNVSTNWSVLLYMIYLINVLVYHVKLVHGIFWTTYVYILQCAKCRKLQNNHYYVVSV